MIKLAPSTVIPNSPFYKQLLGKVDEQILHLQDGSGIFLLDKLTETNLNYYINQVVDKPWNNYVLFAIFVYGDNNLDPETINNICWTINPRLNNLFKFFHLTEMKDFDVEVHLYQYLKGSIYQDHSDNMRTETLKRYRLVAYATKKWVESKLNKEQQSYFEQYLFSIPSFDSRDFLFTKSAKEQTQNTRKSETDAIVPLLPQIRAEGHFRWNQLDRLRQAFLKACEQAKITNVKLPIEFHYDEPERIGERFYFRLWDKPSFVLFHQDKFNSTSVKNAQKRTSTFLDENNHYFVEFIKAEGLDNNEDADGLWFIELFEKGVIGNWSRNSNIEEIKQKKELLLSWGYGQDELNTIPLPFCSHHQEIITPSKFVSHHKDKVKGVLFDIEPIYVATTFGLLALDIFTTTGARLNELLQIRNTKECIRTVKVENKLRFTFYAVPKGRDELEPYYISEQTMKLIQLVGKMLKNHYGTEKIPSVEYRGVRKHHFPEPKPYFFQYHKKALFKDTIWSSLRLLLHGLLFETQEGKPVVIKTHLLRHAFATEAVQRQKLPIDIVAKILHQRDLGVTGYYSQPTPSQVSQSVSDLHDVISDYVDLDEALLRSPQELQKEMKEYKEKVGVFNNVLGGTCVTDEVCPIKMQCVGCQAKIPQPEKKHELIEFVNWNKDSEKRFKSLGLEVEAKKLRTARKYARAELKEIELIEKYREEHKYEPDIQFDK